MSGAETRRGSGRPRLVLVAAVAVGAAVMSAVVVPGPDPSAACGPAGAGRGPVRGLVVIDDVSGVDDLVQGVSVNVPWSQLQPVAGGPLVHPNPVDEALRAAASFPGACTGVKLRVLAGVESPAWAKELGGPPVPLELSYDLRRGQAPRFWQTAFGQAHDELQRLLADAYDDHPLLREVAVSRCTTFYAEPMVRQGYDRASVAALLAAGYTAAADERCQEEQLAGMAVWQQASVLLALNPYERVTGTGTLEVDAPYAVGVGQRCRELFGQRCVVSNNSLRWPLLGGEYVPLYAGMRALGRPLAFQLAAPGRIGELDAVLEHAVDVGAGSVELTRSSVLALQDSPVAAVRRLQGGTAAAEHPAGDASRTVTRKVDPHRRRAAPTG